MFVLFCQGGLERISFKTLDLIYCGRVGCCRLKFKKIPHPSKRPTEVSVGLTHLHPAPGAKGIGRNQNSTGVETTLITRRARPWNN